MKRFVHFGLGGSIDEIKDPVKDALVLGTRSGVGDYLKMVARTGMGFSKTVSLKMSNDLTDVDLQDLLEDIRESGETRVLVTMGKFAIGRVADYLAERIYANQIVFLTGSDHALDGPSYSDARPVSAARALGAARLAARPTTNRGTSAPGGVPGAFATEHTFRLEVHRLRTKNSKPTRASKRGFVRG